MSGTPALACQRCASGSAASSAKASRDCEMPPRGLRYRQRRSHRKRRWRSSNCAAATSPTQPLRGHWAYREARLDGSCGAPSWRAGAGCFISRDGLVPGLYHDACGDQYARTLRVACDCAVRLGRSHRLAVAAFQLLSVLFSSTAG